MASISAPVTAGSPSTRNVKRYHIRFAAGFDINPDQEAAATFLSFPELDAATKDQLRSVFEIAEQFRVLTANPHTAEMRAAAEDFTTCLEAILHGCIHLPSQMRAGPKFHLAFKGVIFSGSGFVERIPATRAEEYFSDKVQVALQWLDMTMSSLRELLQVIQHLRNVPKPLPKVPSLDDKSSLLIESTTTVLEGKAALLPVGFSFAPVEAHTSSAPIIDVSPPSPSTPRRDISMSVDSAYLTPDASAMDATIEPIARGTIVKSSLKRLVLGVTRKNNRKLSTMWSSTSLSKSSTNMAPSPCFASFGEESPTSPFPPSLIGSADIGPVPELDEPEPLKDIYFSASGKLCAATMPALVRLLTSKDAVTDPSLNHLFFFSFRFFSTAQDLCVALSDRCKEAAPDGLAPGQLVCWEDDARVTRVRVAKVVLVWLRLYWRHRWDAAALGGLARLMSSQRAADPKGATIWGQVADQIESAANPSHRGAWAQQLSTPPSTPPSPPLKFQVVTKDAILKGNFQSVDALHFHTATGREELARQLCLAGSEFFCAIDSEDAVHFWKEGHDGKTGDRLRRMAAFENALVYWVANVIAGKPTVRSRVEAMEFYLDLASVGLPFKFLCHLILT
ncbi:hypothetical protein HWV62_3396 [Athelia sp. TMB]|nr:hypothetical protein HWV62_3396 [Athelia sp. TMB]